MPVTPHVLCPVIIGRSWPLGAAHELLERAARGDGGALLVSGEAGVGKSTFVRAVTSSAREAGYVVLQGACFEADRSLPYGALHDLVDGFLVDASPALAQHVLGPALPELLATFPELRSRFGDVAPAPALDPEQDRRRLFHALAHLVRELGRVQPVLLVFEDVHWADDASLELVVHLTRAAAASPVVVALTYRAEEIGPSLARTLAALDRTRLAVELPLERLTAREVGAMLSAIFGGAPREADPLVAVLHELTEGNPFFVEETLKALVMSGDVVPAEGGGWRAQPIERIQVPRTAVEAVRRRLAGLGDEARSLASVAAVAGRRFDFALLGALMPHDEATLLALVKELVVAQLVMEESTERFAFRHALTREAICAELLARERLALHRRVASAIARLHANDVVAHVDALAYHAYEGEDWTSARAHSQQAAAHAMALYAPRAALAHLDRALAATLRLGNGPDLELLLARGRACETLGDFGGAEDAFRRALDGARAAGRRDEEWEALHALGLLWAARDYERAGAYRRAALGVARTLDNPARLARSLDRVGNWHLNLDEPRAGVPFHEEALAIVERSDDARGVGETVDLLAMAAFIGGDLASAATHYQRSIGLFDALGDRRGLANALGLLPLCGPSFQSACTTPWRGSAYEEILAGERGLRMARDIGWRAGEAFCLYLLSDCYGWRGRYDLALPQAREALAIAEEIEHLQWQCAASTTLGTALADLGASELARGVLDRALAIAERLGSRIWQRWVAAPLAMALTDLGDTSAANAVLDTAAVLVGSSEGRRGVGRPEDTDLTLGERKLWLARAYTALAAGKAEEALAIADARLAAEARDRSASEAPPAALAVLRGRALAALGDAAAEGALEAACDAAARDGARPLEWRARAALGRFHLARRERLAARGAFDEARAIGESLAALVADADLRSTFHEHLDVLAPAAPAPSRRQQAKDAFAGLTTRERDVAALVAQGKSNRAAARMLGIGERTVEAHVAASLAKLGFSSRTQLAAWAVEKGLAGTDRPRAR